MSLTLKMDDDTNEALLMHEIARQLRVIFDRRAQHLGLTRAQWQVLGVVRRNPGIKQMQLAGRLEIEPMTLVRTLDRMEKAGWIERRQDPQDRRANSIMLSEKVKNIITEMQAIAKTLRQEAMEGFSAEEHAQLLGYLQRIKNNVSNIMKEDGEEA